MKWIPVLFIAALLSACHVGDSVRQLDRNSPAPELGRPWLVRAVAGTGGWVGASVGALASVVVLPLTYPISLLADEPLGESKTEFILTPIPVGAASGHFLLGAPLDFVHFLFWRAWVDEPEHAGYEFTPMQPPASPEPVRETETEPAPEPATEPGDEGLQQPPGGP